VTAVRRAISPPKPTSGTWLFLVVEEGREVVLAVGCSCHLDVLPGRIEYAPEEGFRFLALGLDRVVDPARIVPDQIGRELCDLAGSPARGGDSDVEYVLLRDSLSGAIALDRVAGF